MLFTQGGFAMLFRVLTEEEKAGFRRWARENYKRGEPISGIWHPEVQEECVRMNKDWARKPVTILDLVLLRLELPSMPEGGLSFAQIESVGLPAMGGCHGCGETLAAFNAHPTTVGYIACAACVGDTGWESAREAEWALFGGPVHRPNEGEDCDGHV